MQEDKILENKTVAVFQSFLNYHKCPCWYNSGAMRRHAISAGLLNMSHKDSCIWPVNSKSVQSLWRFLFLLPFSCINMTPVWIENSWKFFVLKEQVSNYDIKPNKILDLKFWSVESLQSWHRHRSGLEVNKNTSVFTLALFKQRPYVFSWQISCVNHNISVWLFRGMTSTNEDRQQEWVQRKDVKKWRKYGKRKKPLNLVSRSVLLPLFMTSLAGCCIPWAALKRTHFLSGRAEIYIFSKKRWAGRRH